VGRDPALFAPDDPFQPPRTATDCDQPRNGQPSPQDDRVIWDMLPWQ
jgi:hypothetical protein